MAAGRKATQNLDLHRIAEWVLVALGSVVSYALTQGVSHIQAMGKSVEELNRNLAVIVERVGAHDRLLSKHEDEIEALKKR